MTSRHSSGCRSPMVRAIPTPATLASTSSRPCRSSTDPTAAAHDSSLLTSQTTIPAPARRSHPTTSAPSPVNRSATAAPIPPPAPETSATFPSNRAMRCNVLPAPYARYHEADGGPPGKGRRRHRRRGGDREGRRPDLRPRGCLRGGGRHRRGTRPRDGRPGRGRRWSGHLRADRCGGEERRGGDGRPCGQHLRWPRLRPQQRRHRRPHGRPGRLPGRRVGPDHRGDADRGLPVHEG